jgi:hypothetical protein
MLPNTFEHIGLAYLIDQRIKELQCERSNPNNGISLRNSPSNIPKVALWIERLLKTSLPDYRKYCIWRILAPYLLNARKPSDVVSYFVIMTRLEKCLD